MYFKHQSAAALLASGALQGHAVTWLDIYRAGGKRVNALVLLVRQADPVWPQGNAARNGALVASMMNDKNDHDYRNSRTHHHDSGHDQLGIRSKSSCAGWLRERRKNSRD